MDGLADDDEENGQTKKTRAHPIIKLYRRRQYSNPL